MNKIIILSFFAAFVCQHSSAQSRQLRSDEITYFTALHAAIHISLPHTYKDWTKTNDDEDDWDITTQGCMDSHHPDAECKGRTSASLGKTDPYSLASKVSFAMSSEESNKLSTSSFAGIKDYTSADQIATALKTTAATKLEITVVTNIDGGSFSIVYCPKDPLQSIKLSVPTTLAIKGIRSVRCPIIASGQPDTHANYYDGAIIFLGKPVVSKSPEDRSDGTKEMNYKIGFDHTKIGKPITQNIVVTIKGDSADIDAAIALIDWNKLYSMINK